MVLEMSAGALNKEDIVDTTAFDGKSWPGIGLNNSVGT